MKGMSPLKEQQSQVLACLLPHTATVFFKKLMKNKSTEVENRRPWLAQLVKLVTLDLRVVKV